MKTTRTIAGVAALALLGAGCSSEAITERIAEEAAEQLAGEGVEIDLDEEGGGISVDTSEGSLQMGAGGSVPESFPDDLPLPNVDYEIANSFETTNSDDELQVQMSLVTSAPVEEIESFLEQALSDGGWEVSDTRRQSAEGFLNVTFIVQQGDMGAMVSVISDTQDETLVNYLVGNDFVS